MLRMRPAVFFVLVLLLLGGCSDRGTASGPVSPSESSEAKSTNPPASATEKPLTTQAATANLPASAGAKGDDDDSSSPETGAMAPAVVQGHKETLCSDKIDNDGDRAVDCDDTDCWSVAECEAPQADDWSEEGPGPGLGKDGEQAPGPEGADGGAWKPADEGIGVGCADYIGCVCGLAEAEQGRTVAGYSHASACEKSSSLIGNEVEEYCGNELDKLKAILAETADDYAAAKITMPASCN